MKIGCALVGISKVFQIALCLPKIHVLKRKEIWQEKKYFEKSSPFTQNFTSAACHWQMDV